MPFYTLIFVYSILKLVMLELTHFTLRSCRVCYQGRCGQQNGNSVYSPHFLIPQFQTM